jgi:hypothetical protein
MESADANDGGGLEQGTGAAASWRSGASGKCSKGLNGALSVETGLLTILPRALALLIDLLTSAVGSSALTVQNLALCLLEDLLFTGTMAKPLKWERFNTNALRALAKLGCQRFPLCVAPAEGMA